MSSYVPGAGVAVVGHGAAVLLPAEVEPRLAREVHAALVPGVGVADVLQVLTGEFATSLARIPAFALAVLSGSGVQAVARGAFEVHAGGVLVSGEGVSTWTERFVAGVEDVALVAVGADDEAQAWPLEGGIVRAELVLLGAGDALAGRAETARSAGARPEASPASAAPEPKPAARPEEAAAQPATPEARTPAEAELESTVRAELVESLDTSVEPEPEPVPEPEPTPEAEPSLDPEAAPEREPAAAEPEPEAGSVPTPPEPDSVPTPPEPGEETVLPAETVLPSETLLAMDEDESFDHLWGSTVLRPVEQAAVRADEDELDDEPLAPASPPPAALASSPAPAPAPGDAPASTPEPSAPAAPASPASGWKPPFMIEVPGAAPTAPPAASSPLPPAVSSPAAPAAPSPSASPAAPEPLGDHDGETVVRPLAAVVDPAPTPATPGTVGRVRLSTGQVIELDRPVVLGRKPRVSRVGGAAVPRLVTVPSPEQDISRSHLEIRLEGVSVLVVDLGSTNGSTLLRTGQLPVRLHPNEAVLVVDGDVVDLGEGVTLTFEGLA